MRVLPYGSFDTEQARTWVVGLLDGYVTDSPTRPVALLVPARLSTVAFDTTYPISLR